MGNQHSQDLVVDTAVARTKTSHAKGLKRISKSPLIQNFIDSANRPSNTPRSRPSLGGTWYETSSPLYTGRAVAPSLQQQQQQQQLHLQRQKSKNSSGTLQAQQQPPPPPPPPQLFPHAGPKSLNQQQHIVSQTTTTTTTTTQNLSGDPKTPYYVVSTTTYYVNSPAPSINNESIISNPHQQRLSYISQGSSIGSLGGLSENMFTETRTTTTAPSISSRTASKGIEYITLNHRKFMKVPGIPYRLACDDEESDRLVIMHFLLKYAFNGNTVAPIQQILQDPPYHLEKTHKRPHVLDIGCGPGTWILEMATEYPSTDFVGVDIHPMFPCTIKPSNAHFQQCNVLYGLPFPDNSFDYIHVRMMLLCLTQPQALKLLAEIRRVLKPDAIVELIDVEYRIQRPGPISDTLINQKLYHHFEDTYRIRLDAAHHLSTSLTRADCGLVDVYQDHVTIPLGSWGGQLGEAHSLNLVSGFIKALDPDILESVMDQHMCLSEEKTIKIILEECQKYQSHFNWHVSYGRKPKSPNRTAAPPLPSARTSTTVASSSTAAPSLAMGNATTAAEWDSIKEFSNGYMD